MRLCSVHGCKGNAHYEEGGRRGYCCAHYKRFRRRGVTMSGRAAPGELLPFILEVAVPFQGNGCLPWPYGKTTGGYGQLKVEGKFVPANRYVCKIVHGEPPTPEHEAAHSCGNRDCVNPNHVSWKTPLQNKADELIHGTRNFGARNGAAKLTEEHVRKILAMKGNKPRQQIAEEFGVDPRTISKIHLGQRWAWLAAEGRAA